jgi:predicted TIM-barrel fold metal-dependent hydrolase
VDEPATKPLKPMSHLTKSFSKAFKDDHQHKIEVKNMKVMDVHGYISPNVDVEEVHKAFAKWGIHEAISGLDYIDDDLPKAIEQARISGRIHPIIAIPPQLRSAPDYLEKSLKMGFSALKIHSQIHGFKHDDPNILSTIRKAEELGISVFVHTGPTWSTGPFNEDMGAASTLPYLFPEVKFIFYKGDIRLARWLLRKLDNLYLDTSNFPNVTLNECRLLFNWGLGDRILFGTGLTLKKDGELSYHEKLWEIIRSLELDESTRKKVLQENWKKAMSP